jgi:hypothetical protein
MRNGVAKRKKKDELYESCIQCGKERLTAYWDYELEYYIYLSESSSTPCVHCQNTEQPVSSKVSQSKVLESVAV